MITDLLTKLSNEKVSSNFCGPAWAQSQRPMCCCIGVERDHHWVQRAPNARAGDPSRRRSTSGCTRSLRIAGRDQARHERMLEPTIKETYQAAPKCSSFPHPKVGLWRFVA